MQTANHPALSSVPLATATAPDDAESLLSLARAAGMLVTLDGQIGREKYQSIAGSLGAFQRFAAALRAALSAAN
ncbi:MULTISPECIES: hypothetical protein [Paraburkholderia]|uniref:Uncharacterized protein n=1 Tax=Paraburkholderia tropica TaxID=92647 RepID=A0A1A5XK13_9BURK|nr:MULTISPECIES: hypothetical protein [Paraburkholderia]MBB2981155.1 hypothetical protein [Paraburkholderia tropica]MBB3004551.1 hypothetical protein [Paraburkholderia tropica]MBB6323668.1 hypothetical protein [Paraburkholderia tropica]MDE1138530.1 hypothetical protein [Paraburkholderia tropica]OBR53448.1 hypothetical protein A6456_31430 [Paraburkholderia tropica]